MKCIANFGKPCIFFSLALLVPCLVCAAQAVPPIAVGESSALRDAPSTLTSSPPQTITLKEAVVMAERNSPQIRNAQAATERAVAGTRTARAYINPIVEVYAGDQYARAVSNPGAPGLLQHYAGYQPIEIPRERNARRRVAEYGSRSSRFAQEATTRSVVANAKQAFYN